MFFETCEQFPSANRAREVLGATSIIRLRGKPLVETLKNIFGAIDTRIEIGHLTHQAVLQPFSSKCCNDGNSTPVEYPRAVEQSVATSHLTQRPSRLIRIIRPRRRQKRLLWYSPCPTRTRSRTRLPLHSCQRNPATARGWAMPRTVWHRDHRSARTGRILVGRQDSGQGASVIGDSPSWFDRALWLRAGAESEADGPGTGAVDVVAGNGCSAGRDRRSWRCGSKTKAVKGLAQAGPF